MWRWSDRKQILISASQNDFNVVYEESKMTVQLKDRIKKGRKPKTIWFESKYDASSSGTMLIKKLFGGDKVFSYPKSLYTLIDTLKVITSPYNNEIVLDFFGGSATTAHAVLQLNKEDNGNRKFIICEQMDYIETVTSERVKKAINLNKSGSFVYAELMQYNQKYIDLIQNAETKNQLIAVWNEMQDTAFLSYQFDKKTFNERLEAFKTAPIDEMKQYLIEVLDKNQLYVNYSEINDETFKVSKEDKELNKQFYSKK